MWEAMNMLLRDSADYLNEPKVAFMADLRPMTEMAKNFPSLITDMMFCQRNSEEEKLCLVCTTHRP